MSSDVKDQRDWDTAFAQCHKLEPSAHAGFILLYERLFPLRRMVGTTGERDTEKLRAWTSTAMKTEPTQTAVSFTKPAPRVLRTSGRPIAVTNKARVGERIIPSDYVEPQSQFAILPDTPRPLAFKKDTMIFVALADSSKRMTSIEICFGSALAFQRICALIGLIPQSKIAYDIAAFLHTIDSSGQDIDVFLLRIMELCSSASVSELIARFPSVFLDASQHKRAAARASEGSVERHRSLYYASEPTQAVMRILVNASIDYRDGLGYGETPNTEPEDHALAAYHVACCFFALRHTGVSESVLLHVLLQFDRHIQSFWEHGMNAPDKGVVFSNHAAMTAWGIPAVGDFRATIYNDNPHHYRYLMAMLVLHDERYRTSAYYSPQAVPTWKSDQDKVVEEVLMGSVPGSQFNAMHVARAYLFLTAVRAAKTTADTKFALAVLNPL